MTSVDGIIELYARKAAGRYGSERVTQLEHALQCAQLARAEAASVELAAAAFLHDIGHLLVERPHAIGRKIDDLHQFAGLPFLRALFGDAVLEPIRLHVDAKRYLCHAEAGYWDSLSPASKHSLELQGGPMSGSEASAFLGRRFAAAAIRLRRWDDAAKQVGRAVPGLDALSAVLHAAAQSRGQSLGRV